MSLHVVSVPPIEQWTIVRKTVNEDVSSSTVVQNDDELFFQTVAGAVYEVEILLVYVSAVGAGTPDLKFDLGEDSAARGVFFPVGGFSTADAALATGLLANQTATVSLGTSAFDRAALYKGQYAPAGGGIFRVRWAQDTSNANATTMRVGSLIRYRRILL